MPPPDPSEALAVEEPTPRADDSPTTSSAAVATTLKAPATVRIFDGISGNGLSLEITATLSAAPAVAPPTLVPTTVELTDPSSTFDLSAIEGTLEKHSIALETCGPDASRLGKTQPLEIRVALDAEGRPTRIDWQVLPPGAVRECVQRQLLAIRFPKTGRPLELRTTWVQR